MTIVDFKPAHAVVTVGNQTIKWPTSKNELLQSCKRLLIEEDYRDVLCGIMDEDIFKEIDSDLQVIVENYFKFPN